MGLDMYLYKVNRKASNDDELKEVLKLSRFVNAEFNSYKVYLEDNNKQAYLGTIFRPEFIEKYNDCDEEAVKYFDDHIATIKVAYDEKENNGEIYTSDIGYWRKHPDLHGYFTGIYEERGGEESFNCEPLLLSKNECLDVIEYSKQMIKKIEDGDDIEHTELFFFGQTEKSDWEHTIEVFNNVIETVDFYNESVYYDSWW